MALAHHHRSGPGPVDRGERGSVLILVALCLSVLITATALTVDLGRISTTRRDLQKTADVAALDLSRLLDGRTAAQIVAAPSYAATLTASLERNGFTLTTRGRQAIPSLGSWDPTTQVFTAALPGDVPTAAKVVLEEDVDHQFAPGGVRASRTGIAGQTAAAGFSVGSFAARLDTAQSALLEPLLGDALGVTLVGYSGLAGGHVGLAALATELGLSVGSPTALLTTELTLLEVIQAQAAVLRAGGDLARAQLLDDLAVALPNPDLPILLGDVLSIATGGEEAAGLADLDALELLTTVAYVANGESFLDLPDVGLTIPGGLVTTTARVQVIQSPRFAFGPRGTTADTAQVVLEVELTSVVPGAGTTSITLTLTSASARGTSTAIGCNSPQLLDLAVTTGLVTSRADVAATIELLGIPIADVTMHADTGSSPVARTFAFDFPPDELGVAQQVPTPGLNLGGAEVVTDDISVIGIQLPGVVEAAVGTLTSTVVTPLLAALDATLVTPLAGILGLTVAGVDVTPTSVACSGPNLIG